VCDNYLFFIGIMVSFSSSAMLSGVVGNWTGFWSLLVSFYGILF